MNETGSTGIISGRGWAKLGEEIGNVPAAFFRQSALPLARGVPIDAPDPGKPARLYKMGGEHKSRGKRWLAQSERRSIILAASRRQLAEQGYDGVCLKHVASMCNMPKQTIYNIVGSRDEMIQKASAEWVEWLAIWTLSGSPPAKLLAVLGSFWFSVTAFREYTAQSVQASCAPTSPLNASFREKGVQVVLPLLSDLAARDQLRPTLDLVRFSWHLTETVHAGTCRWIMASCSDREFQRDFVYGPGMMLLGALRGQEALLVEQHIEAELAR